MIATSFADGSRAWARRGAWTAQDTRATFRRSTACPCPTHRRRPRSAPRLRPSSQGRRRRRYQRRRRPRNRRDGCDGSSCLAPRRTGASAATRGRRHAPHGEPLEVLSPPPLQAPVAPPAAASSCCCFSSDVREEPHFAAQAVQVRMETQEATQIGGAGLLSADDEERRQAAHRGGAARGANANTSVEVRHIQARQVIQDPSWLLSDGSGCPEGRLARSDLLRRAASFHERKMHVRWWWKASSAEQRALRPPKRVPQAAAPCASRRAVGTRRQGTPSSRSIGTEWPLRVADAA